ncbi:MAG: hypothetical protein PWP56_2563 [Acetobacterium sp.]|nr:hypothetical protein [Acetobacterium sp.]
MRKYLSKLSLLLMSLLLIGVSPVSVMAAAQPSVSYRTHVQNEGWQNYVSNGTISGTSGKSLRLEGIEIKLDSRGADLGISYQTHIENIGWEADTSRGWKNNGAMSGTSGLSYRLEAIQIKLTGADADQFDVYYQVHAQNIGWMGWAKNGESAGTAGFGYRLEGIRIELVPAGSAAPGSTAKAFVERNGDYIFNEKLHTGIWLDFAYFPEKMVRNWTFNQDGTGVLIENQVVNSTYNYATTDVSQDGSSGKVTLIGPNINTTKSIVFSYFADDGSLKMTMDGKALWIARTREI